jgi:hypothetical protein
VVVSQEKRERRRESQHGGAAGTGAIHVPPRQPERERIHQQLRIVVRWCGDQEQEREKQCHQRRRHRTRHAKAQIEREHLPRDDQEPLHGELSDQAVADQQLRDGRQNPCQRCPPVVEVSIRPIAGEQGRCFPQRVEVRVVDLIAGREHQDESREPGDEQVPAERGGVGSETVRAVRVGVRDDGIHARRHFSPITTSWKLRWSPLPHHAPH